MGAFSIFKGKKKGKKQDAGGYYRRLSFTFALLKFACLILALATVLYGFSFRTDEINADNFRYLLSFLGEGETETETYNTIYFDNNESNRFALVRGDLAVVSNSGVAVYSLGGLRRSVDTSFKMDSPEVMYSAKYMYVYDIGGTELVIKSTLETMETKKYDFPLRGAAATSNGIFAVISEKKTSRSTVFVYDDSFREIYNCSYGSLYTLSVDLDSEGKRLATASVESVGGEFVTSLYMYSLDSKEPKIQQTVKGEYPYRVAFGKDGEILLLTDKACRFYNSKGEQSAVLEFGTEGISRYGIGESYFLRQYPLSALSAATRLEVYGIADGKLVFSRDFDGGLRLAEVEGNYLFTAAGEELSVISLENGEERTLSTEGEVLALLPVEEGKTLTLTEGTGNVLNYKELFETKGETSEWEQ